ncbi:MAG: hypothetical protein IJ604_15000 [Prevotella sp.]|nr:hypothetical protein [Prevotella sp.]MBR1464668.1 hypothetical protein [Prevotella sp.]
MGFLVAGARQEDAFQPARGLMEGFSLSKKQGIAVDTHNTLVFSTLLKTLRHLLRYLLRYLLRNIIDH